MKEAKDILDTLYTLQQQVARFTTIVSPMTLNDYQQAMQRTYKPNRKANHALGVAGEVSEATEQHDKDLVAGTVSMPPTMLVALEALRDRQDVQRSAGRICDAVKKEEYHGRLADRMMMLKELGDVLWYVSALATDYGFTLENVATGNVEKLKTRYPEGFVKGGGVR